MRLLGLLLIGLGLWLVFVCNAERSVVRQVIDEEPRLINPVPSDLEAPNLGDYDEVLQRPLFSPQRRPFIAPKPEPVPPPRVRLSAVSVSNSVRVAVIEDLSTNRTRHVREGDKLDQWVVKKVSPNSVILELKDRTIKIPLFGGS